jgi:hypothetical protein
VPVPEHLLDRDQVNATLELVESNVPAALNT